MAINAYRRLECRNVDLSLEIADGIHPLIVSLAYDETGTVRELAFVGRGKIGQGLDLLLHDLGIKISRALQGRDPDTGEARRSGAGIAQERRRVMAAGD